MPLDRNVIELYDEYTHKPLPRRVFLERLTVLAGGAAAAQMALAVLEPDYAHAATVAADDPGLSVRAISEVINGTTIRGYLAQGKVSAKRPAVLVVHENRGLNPHIEDIARRLAAGGFLALALDFLAPLGGTPQDADKAREMFGTLDRAAVIAQGRAALQWLKAQPAGNGKAGAIGFCWGGGTVNALATQAPELDAGVVFYGQAPAPEAAARIKAPLLLNHAGLDSRINEGLPAYEAALKAAGARYTLHVYEGVNHAFMNDTSAERYDPKAAALAWDRSVAFLKKELA